MKSIDGTEKLVSKVLQDYKPHHASELIPITHRFSAAIERLRKKGYKIETLYLDGRNKPAWYQLVSTSVVA
jgi:hypothetical protein